MYLMNLYEQLGVKDDFDKALVSALVFETLRSNPCGMSSENEDKVKEVLTEGVDTYKFKVLSLATTWSNDMEDYFMKHMGIEGSSLFKHYIWPYIRENEVIPGVKMQN